MKADDQHITDRETSRYETHIWARTHTAVLIYRLHTVCLGHTLSSYTHTHGYLMPMYSHIHRQHIQYIIILLIYKYLDRSKTLCNSKHVIR